jgi:hypothetical protein
MFLLRFLALPVSNSRLYVARSLPLASAPQNPRDQPSALRLNRVPRNANSSISAPKPKLERAGTLAIVTVNVALDELLAEFGSAVVEETVAVFTTGPAAFGLTTTSVIVAELPFAITPKLQVTVLVPAQDPCDDAVDTNVVPVGRTSVTVTALAEFGPAFETVRV